MLPAAAQVLAGAAATAGGVRIGDGLAAAITGAGAVSAGGGLLTPRLAATKDGVGDFGNGGSVHKVWAAGKGIPDAWRSHRKML